MYILITLNHIRAVKAWAEAHQGAANLNLLNFELEIKANHRYYTLYPQFQGKVNGQLVHIPAFTNDSKGFIGWLPYKPLAWPLGSDKLQFKAELHSEGLLTPDWWDPKMPARHDYILKKSIGSFGYDLRGPYHASRAAEQGEIAQMMARNQSGEVFGEQFIHGKIVKAWFWGSTPFHLQLYARPSVAGNGQQTALELVRTTLESAGLSLETYPELSFVKSSIEFQGFALDHVIPRDVEVWIDYRYGRQFAQEATQSGDDNALGLMSPKITEQISTLGKHLAGVLSRQFPAPVQYSVDGVLDQNGDIWWLEMNSNPIFPPTGYAYMLSTLFGTQMPAASFTPPASVPDLHHTTRIALGKLEIPRGWAVEKDQLVTS